MPQPLIWTQLKQTGKDIPACRTGHTFVTIGKNLHVMFGGLEGLIDPKTGKKENKVQPSNNVYVLKLVGNDSCEWKQINCIGDIPLPRCHHAAVNIGNEQMLVFGGYYTSNIRFNDTFILKINNWQWYQPPNQKQTEKPKSNAESKIGAPEPRGNHSAVFIKGKVYVFGGHGGTNYQRVSFNDLYTLDIETFEWEKKQPEGNLPEARGGHAATQLAQQDKMVIFGGWNFQTQFGNMMIYDITKNMWVDPEVSPESAKWNMCAIMAFSIPSWKFFIFGGSVGSFEEGGHRTTSKFVNDVQYLECDELEWKTPKLFDANAERGYAGLRPKARETAAVVYDQQDARFVVFGGWSNNWLGDVWSLSVGSITGPPYAIFSIKPSRGPLTGRTKIRLIGDGFKQSNVITVKFLYVKSMFKGQPEEVAEEFPGTYVSDKEIVAQTPNFEQHGPRKVEVYLSINKSDFTITKSYYNFFLNSKAETCIAYGPGLLGNNAIGVDTVFVIQARNMHGENRDSGSDTFRVEIIRPDKIVEKGQQEEQQPNQEEVKEDEKKEEEKKEEPKAEENKQPKEGATEEKSQTQEKQEKPETQQELNSSSPVLQKNERKGSDQDKNFEEQFKDPWKVRYQIIDKDDGSYEVYFKQDEECTVNITIYFVDEKGQWTQIRGNPYKSSFKKAATPEHNKLFGIQSQEFLANSLAEIGNFIDTAKDKIDIRNKNIAQNIEELITVIEYLQKIKDNKDTHILCLDTIQEMLRAFEKGGELKELELQKCLKLQEEWKNLYKMSIAVEKDIHGQRQKEEEKTKEKIKKFEEQIKDFNQSLKKEVFFAYKTGVVESLKNITDVNNKFSLIQKELQKYQYFCRTFDFPQEADGCDRLLQTCQAEIESYTKLWKQIDICQKKFAQYLQIKWVELNISDIEDEVKKLRKNLMDIKGIDRKSNAWVGIQDEMKKWNTFLPLVSELKDVAMEVEDGRHWSKVKKLIKQEFDVDEKLLLGKMWEIKLFDFKEGVEDVTDQAKQELKMEKSLNIIIKFWKEVVFELLPHKNSEISTLKMSDENFETLEEHQLQINNMLLSKYIAYFEKRVEKWKSDLGSVYDVVQLISDVQKTWSFLENLFIQSEEVKKELPKESEQFVGIDKDMKDVMNQGCQIKNVLQFCTIPGLLKRLENIEKQLKMCEKALQEFLDNKRKAFPRFYFVSVNDLLDILSNGNSPAKINRHMSKIFQAIEKVILEESSDRPFAVEMISGVGIEQVKFSQKFKLVGKVEIYLQDIINQMNETLKSIANSSFDAFTKVERKEWISRDPSQITILVNNIIWSSNVEESFIQLQKGDMNSLKKFLDKSIEALTQLIKMVQGDLDKGMRQKIMCLITLDTHSRDVVIRLIDEHVRKSDEFQWQSQLKFYWTQNTCQIRIADASFWYYYEYLGNGPRLVVTPLTDRIYVTATQALHLKMGCAPAGPAGTGKTETTKDLANAVAKAIYVYNCSGEMNYITMGNIYKGLASSGCWGCFDEFNRLLPEVLSVCSVQFKSITDAIKRNAKRFVLDGDEIAMDLTCGVFITMNPGYLGRTELPEGLKTLFRPITVVVPDIELICENMLMAEGFVSAKLLAKKFVTLYSLCRDLLSKQLHYDWGLRAIKSVLIVAGAFKRAEPDIQEQALLMRALRDFNLPKIPENDLYVFYGLLGDLFPGLDILRKRDMKFEEIIEKVSIETKYYPHPEFILKVVQLYELLAIRHCVFILGNPGAGKSAVWKILAKAQDKDGKKTIFVDIDPKVVSTRDFYGYNLPSKEWKDGLFSNKLRMLAEIPDKNPKWILLDGDLDTAWIESMNSLMDDNKILTLANNERIPLKLHMRAIFEIRDLRFASPATVSRAGILYISDDDGHQWKSIVNAWIENEITDPEMKKNLNMLFEKYVSETLRYMRKSCKFNVPISPLSQVASTIKTLSYMLKSEVKNLEYIFVYAFIWGISGCLGEKDGIDYRKEFSNWWKGAWKSQVKFPNKGTIYEYFVDQSGDTIKFTEWQEKLSTIEFDPYGGQQMGNVTVPTIETLATSNFIKKYIIEVSHPTLMIGQAGSGKTQLGKGILRQIVSEKPENFAYQLINFNYYTDSTYLQAQLEQTLEKKAGRQFGPPGKLRMIYFIDDLNMPQLDKYDTQNAIALLRQHADYGHWYDISKLALKDIINTQTLAAMNPSAGSFFVNPRYMRHFWTIYIPFPDNESLSLIYLTFLNGHLKKFKNTIQELANTIVRTTLIIHTNVCGAFKKTSTNFHYEFNLRHISNIFQGLLLSDFNKIGEPEKILKLWIHECDRTYGDRLVTLENLKTFKEQLADVVKKQFTKYNFTKYFQGTPPENLIFCNFPNGIAQDRYYDQMPNDRIEKYINEALDEYNDNNAVMNLVLFEDAIKHVCRICRIILPPSGHALLVGVGGSGKQSLSKLASYIMNYSPASIVIHATYSMADLRTDLQGMYQKSGVKDEQLMFLFTEGQIANERFLVYINDLLSSGEISELYQLEEKEQIINQVRNKVKSEGIADTRDNCWNFFINCVKKNLHMVICVSPVGDIKRRARQFPALINCTAIDWFQPWPYEALYNVAKKFLEPIDLGEDNVRQAIVTFMPFSFTIVNQLGTQLLEQERRYAYTTPKSFLELIQLFQNMLEKKRNLLEQAKERYESGLVKLRETAAQVAVIEVEVKEKKIEAEAKQREADAFAEVVGKEKNKVEKENAKAKIEAENCAEIKADVEQKKAETQKDLDNALPLVEQAKEALNSIQKKDFQIAKSFSSPPAGVPEVFFAVMYMLSTFWPEAIETDKNKKPKQVDWKSSLKMMKNPEDFLKRLIEFKDIVDQNLVPITNVNFVKQNYLKMESFTPDQMANKSGAAKGVCEWVINIVKYHDVIQDIEPKRKALKEATDKLEEATIKLNQIEEVVRKLNEELAKLTNDFNKAVAEKNAAIAEAERCARRLNLAQRLVTALASENDRWAQSIVDLEQQLQLIVGDVLMASSFVSYAGPFNKKFREIMIKQKFLEFVQQNQIPISPNPMPVKLLTDESTIAQWNKDKLPTDTVSIENGAILVNSERYPLMVDPQLQGITWIKQKERDNNLKLLRLGSKYLNRDLELAIEHGFSAIIENMDERIDAIIMPVVARQFIKRGKNKIVKFAGKDLTLANTFKLFLQTKLSNPHYPPEVQAEAAMINFTVTEEGLGDQLLALVVQRERPDLSRKKVALISQQNDFKIKLKQLEDEVLYKLANAQGDILDNISLIENLETSKKLSNEIKEKVEVAKITEAKINETSEGYRPAAIRGALIYFLLSDLPKIHSFYKFSLESFIIVIHRAIDQISERKIYGGESMQETFNEEEEKAGQKEEAEEEAESPLKSPTKIKNQQEQDKLKHEQQEKQDAEHNEKILAEKNEEEEDMNPITFKKRVEDLTKILTYTAYQYMRRGLFERHKLIVATMLTFRILLRSGELKPLEVEQLILGKVEPNPPPIPEPLKNFVNDLIWAACRALEINIPAFHSLSHSLEADQLQWKKWYNEEKAELAELPKAMKDLTQYHKLLVLRAMRQDRVTSALAQYVKQIMGEEYIEQPPFNMLETFTETTNKIPVFFVLFPGVDPTRDVEQVAAKYNISIENGRFINISMGQGQEERAKKAVFDCAKKGHWVMLQNLHLMQNWLYGISGLEGFLEQVFASPTTHKNFRIFLSSEPPPLQLMTIIPESISQAALKISNESPQDLKANLRRAYAKFDQDFLNKCDKKPNEFKACLFALCFFHSLMLGRKKFGSQGWSKSYNFNEGDLTICADVLFNYLSKYDIVPWDDLRYIFGEIMYGGHITDDWDRRTNSTYLKVLIKPDLLSPHFNLAPNFKSPDASKFDYSKYKNYIETSLPHESPQMFGMHPNAEIGYLTQQGLTLFDTILEIQSGSGNQSGKSKDEGVLGILGDLLHRRPAEYNLIVINEKVKEKTPFVLVCLQELERMNDLLQEIKRSLEELKLGLTGALNITDAMEVLSTSLSYNKVPESWEKKAYYSKKTLLQWYQDLIERNKQLIAWSTELETPKSLCISYLFNPMSFLTAVMQFTARKQGLPLDNICIQTDITIFKDEDDVRKHADNGKFIHGLYLEGAAWEMGSPDFPGYLVEQKPKELHPKLPVVNVIAVPTNKKKVAGQYQCPVYVTSQRGPTYVFTANLNMESEDSDQNKWILSGTCLLMSDD